MVKLFTTQVQWKLKTKLNEQMENQNLGHVELFIGTEEAAFSQGMCNTNNFNVFVKLFIGFQEEEAQELRWIILLIHLN